MPATDNRPEQKDKRLFIGLAPTRLKTHVTAAAASLRTTMVQTHLFGTYRPDCVNALRRLDSARCKSC